MDEFVDDERRHNVVGIRAKTRRHRWLTGLVGGAAKTATATMTIDHTGNRQEVERIKNRTEPKESETIKA